MTNNFSIFAEQSDNVLSEQEYAENSARINGVQSGIASSALHNTSMFQVSAMTKAIADMLEENGYNADYTDPAGLANSVKASQSDMLLSYSGALTVPKGTQYNVGSHFTGGTTIPVTVNEGMIENRDIVFSFFLQYPPSLGTTSANKQTYAILLLDSSDNIVETVECSVQQEESAANNRHLLCAIVRLIAIGNTGMYLPIQFSENDTSHQSKSMKSFSFGSVKKVAIVWKNQYGSITTYPNAKVFMMRK